MTEPHTCDFWMGVCSCGKSRRPLPTPDLSPSELETVKRFGLDVEEPSSKGQLSDE